MGQNNYRSRWHPRLPRVGAAATRDANSNHQPFDRVLPVIQLNLAPVFASSFSRNGPVKNMTNSGKRLRGPFSFSVFRDDDGAPAAPGEEAHSHSELQKRQRPDDHPRERPDATALPRAEPSTTAPRSQPAFASSTPSDDLVDRAQPLVNPYLPRDSETRLSSRESPPPKHSVRRSLPPLSTHLGHTGAPDLTTASAPRPTPRHARATSASADRAIIQRLSSALEPGDAPLPPRSPVALKQLWSTPSSPALSPVTCKRSSTGAGGLDETPAEQQSLSDRSDTLTTRTSLHHQPASDLTDSTLTDPSNDHSYFELRQAFNSKSESTPRQPKKTKRINAATTIMGPEPEPAKASPASLFTKVTGVLSEKSANMKRSMPFKRSETPSKSPEKISIGAPYDVRQGAGAMSTPARRPKDGEDARTWGAPELVDKKPEIPDGAQQPGYKAHEEPTTSDDDLSADRGRGSPTNTESDRKKGSGRDSPQITALPTRPPANLGLRALARMSRLALNDHAANEGRPNDSLVDVGDRTQQAQYETRMEKERESLLERMKNTFNPARRQRRCNTTAQTAVNLHQPSLAQAGRDQSALRASQSVTMLPPINSGPAITLSSMNMSPGSRMNNPGAKLAASHAELPAFATEPSIASLAPNVGDVSGHNGFYLMPPLGSHTDVMNFSNTPAAAIPLSATAKSSASNVNIASGNASTTTTASKSSDNVSSTSQTGLLSDVATNRGGRMSSPAHHRKSSIIDGNMICEQSDGTKRFMSLGRRS